MIDDTIKKQIDALAAKIKSEENTLVKWTSNAISFNAVGLVEKDMDAIAQCAKENNLQYILIPGMRDRPLIRVVFY